MALTQHANGTQSATLDTEHTLTANPETTAGVFVLVVNLVNMAIGDIVIFRFKQKALTGDTEALSEEWSVGPGVPNSKIWESPPCAAMHAWDFSLEQTDGTGRSFPWSVRLAA